jgi:hypothetical protein
LQGNADRKQKDSTLTSWTTACVVLDLDCVTMQCCIVLAMHIPCVLWLRICEHRVSLPVARENSERRQIKEAKQSHDFGRKNLRNNVSMNGHGDYQISVDEQRRRRRRRKGVPSQPGIIDYRRWTQHCCPLIISPAAMLLPRCPAAGVVPDKRGPEGGRHAHRLSCAPGCGRLKLIHQPCGRITARSGLDAPAGGQPRVC